MVERLTVDQKVTGSNPVPGTIFLGGGGKDKMAGTGEKTKRLVEPQTLKGFQDLLPEDMIILNAVIEKIRKVYEKYGFLPLDTPILEYLATLVGTGGEETNKQLFRLESPEGEPVAMRFDLTVPFARLIAQYPGELGLPFRRYHIGPVFRADEPSIAIGRFRQFIQFDIDAAGSELVAVDAEIIATMCEAMREIGFNNYMDGDTLIQEFQIRINNRKLIDALLAGCGITDTEKHKHILRIVDKLQKVGVDNVRQELGAGRIDKSGDPIRGAELPPGTINEILDFISISGSSRQEVIELLTKQLPDSEASETALQDMHDLAAALESLKVSEWDAVFDPSLTRGLDYYTDFVFETFLPSAPEVGSVMGGGRYDHLVERFLDDMVPCTGVSIGLERLIVVLKKLGKAETVATTTKVLVLSMSGVTPVDLLEIASELRAENIPTEVYFGKPGTGMREQLSFANTKGIPVAVIMGEDEKKAGRISVKDLQVGMEKRAGIDDRQEYVKAGRLGQVTVERGSLVQTVKDVLDRYS